MEKIQSWVNFFVFLQVMSGSLQPPKTYCGHKSSLRFSTFNNPKYKNYHEIVERHCQGQNSMEQEVNNRSPSKFSC